MMFSPKPFEDIQYEYDKIEHYVLALLKGYIPRSNFLLWQVKRFFAPLICSPDDLLTPEEISDAKESLKEIHEGKAKKFGPVEEFLTWLKSE